MIATTYEATAFERLCYWVGEKIDPLYHWFILFSLTQQIVVLSLTISYAVFMTWLMYKMIKAHQETMNFLNNNHFRK